MSATEGGLKSSACGELKSGHTALRFEAKNACLKRSAPQAQRRDCAECSSSAALLKRSAGTVRSAPQAQRSFLVQHHTFNKRIDTAIQNIVNIAHIQVNAVILYHLVGV